MTDHRTHKRTDELCLTWSGPDLDKRGRREFHAKRFGPKQLRSAKSFARKKLAEGAKCVSLCPVEYSTDRIMGFVVGVHGPKIEL